jgi:hypothetical protein
MFKQQSYIIRIHFVLVDQILFNACILIYAIENEGLEPKELWSNIAMPLLYLDIPIRFDNFSKG